MPAASNASTGRPLTVTASTGAAVKPGVARPASTTNEPARNWLPDSGAVTVTVGGGAVQVTAAVSDHVPGRGRHGVAARTRTGQREYGPAQAVGKRKPGGRVRAGYGEIHAHAGQRLRRAVGQRGDEDLLVAHQLAGRLGRQFKIRDGVDPPERLAARIAVGVAFGKTVGEDAEE